MLDAVTPGALLVGTSGGPPDEGLDPVWRRGKSLVLPVAMAMWGEPNYSPPSIRVTSVNCIAPSFSMLILTDCP